MLDQKIKWGVWGTIVVVCLTVAVRPTLRTWWHNRKHPDIFVFRSGQGEPVLLLHGLTGTHRYWQPVIDALEGDYSLIAPDLPGFGNSIWPDNGYTVYEEISALETIFPSGRFDLIGHSMGSQIAIEIAKRHPDRIKSLVLLAPPSFRDRADLKEAMSSESTLESIMAIDRLWAPLICHLHEVLGELSYYLYRPFVRRALPDYIVKDAIKHTWQSYNNSLENIVMKVFSADEIASLKVPTKVLIGRDDRYSRNDLLTSRYANVQMLPGGHNFLWESTAETVRAIQGFLEAHSGGNGPVQDDN